MIVCYNLDPLLCPPTPPTAQMTLHRTLPTLVQILLGVFSYRFRAGMNCGAISIGGVLCPCLGLFGGGPIRSFGRDTVV